MRRALVVGLTVLALGSPAEAVTLTANGVPYPQPFQRWANASAVPTVRGAVPLRLSNGLCGMGYGCSGPGYGVVLRLDLTRYGARFTLLHELAHVFDYRMMDWAARDRYRFILDDWRAWNAGHFAPSELFAESYAALAMGDTRPFCYASRCVRTRQLERTRELILRSYQRNLLISATERG